MIQKSDEQWSQMDETRKDTAHLMCLLQTYVAKACPCKHYGPTNAKPSGDSKSPQSRGYDYKIPAGFLLAATRASK